MLRDTQRQKYHKQTFQKRERYQVLSVIQVGFSF